VASTQPLGAAASPRPGRRDHGHRPACAEAAADRPLVPSDGDAVTDARGLALIDEDAMARAADRLVQHPARRRAGAEEHPADRRLRGWKLRPYARQFRSRVPSSCTRAYGSPSRKIRRRRRPASVRRRRRRGRPPGYPQRAGTPAPPWRRIRRDVAPIARNGVPGEASRRRPTISGPRTRAPPATAEASPPTSHGPATTTPG
jgi:hypothetical protein